MSLDNTRTTVKYKSNARRSVTSKLITRTALEGRAEFARSADRAYIRGEAGLYSLLNPELNTRIRSLLGLPMYRN